MTMNATQRAEREKFADNLIASVRNQPSKRRALRADDGVDYRRLVLSRLTEKPTRAAHPDSARLWQQANERLDQLGL